MSVLVQFSALVIRRSAIERYYRGGSAQFELDIPKPTYCADQHLLSFDFMDTMARDEFLRTLQQRGLRCSEDGESDICLVDMCGGPEMACDWLRFEGPTKCPARCWWAGDEPGDLVVFDERKHKNLPPARRPAPDKSKTPERSQPARVAKSLPQTRHPFGHQRSQRDGTQRTERSSEAAETQARVASTERATRTEDAAIDDGIPVIDLSGEGDLYTAPEFEKRMTELIESGKRHIVIDLSHATFTDEHGLGWLVGGVKRLRAAGGSLALVVTDDNITKIFEITGLDRVFPIYTSREEAFAALGSLAGHPQQEPEQAPRGQSKGEDGRGAGPDLGQADAGEDTAEGRDERPEYHRDQETTERRPDAPLQERNGLTEEVGQLSAQLRDHQDAQAARRHKIALLTAAALSYVASFFIFVYLWKPINDGEFNLVRWDWGQFLFGVWPLLLFVVGLSVSWIEAPRRMWSSLSNQAPTHHYLAAALLVPTICLTAWFFYFRPKHAVYDEARNVWAAYTHRFPENVLGPPWITFRHKDTMDLCARYGSSKDPPAFCIEFDGAAKPGQQVVGGFKTRYVEYFESDLPLYDAYDCFGRTDECESK